MRAAALIIAFCLGWLAYLSLLTLAATPARPCAQPTEGAYLSTAAPDHVQYNPSDDIWRYR